MNNYSIDKDKGFNISLSLIIGNFIYNLDKYEFTLDEFYLYLNIFSNIIKDKNYAFDKKYYISNNDNFIPLYLDIVNNIIISKSTDKEKFERYYRLDIPSELIMCFDEAYIEYIKIKDEKVKKLLK